MSSPVWVTSSSINCASTRSCFSSCYSDPTEGNDLSFRCVDDFVYLNCGKFMFVVAILIVPRFNNYIVCCGFYSLLGSSAN